MTPGYIYVLQNELFGPYVVKIGLTRFEPDTRAKQIYNGSTGVPIPFDIVTAYSVGDCKQAETAIHKRLKAFRIHGRREFFRTTPSVAASLVYETCAQINTMLGLTPPKPYIIKLREPKLTNSNLEAIERSISIPEDSQEPIRIAYNKIKRAPVGTSSLSSDQADRIKIVAMLLSKIFPSKVEEWLEGFTRDSNPERELCVWEHITKAYLTIEEIDIASDDLKNEAFSLLLHRSAAPTTEVLAEAALKHMNKKSAKRLLQAYELKPKPLVIKKRHDSFIDNIKF